VVRINDIKENKKVIIAVAVSLLFVIAAMTATALNNNLLWLLPVVLAVIIFAIVSSDRLLILSVFFVPVSIQLSYLTGEAPFDLSIPTEPIAALLLFIVLFKLIVKHEFSVKILKHPVSVIILIYLLWTFITSVTSEMPLVSFKTLFYRMWFTAAFYLLATQIFLKKRNEYNYVLAYSLGLAIVSGYFMVKTGGVGLFNQKFAHMACSPFFRDHTSFGASLAFCIPPLIVMFFNKGKPWLLKMGVLSLVVLFSVALLFSYSRAAWVSLIAGLATGFILWLKIPLKILFISFAIVFTGLIFSAGVIWQNMNETTEDSSADLKKHLISSSNISTDQSNLERINRWKSAFRMFEEKPVTGWGPGTYQFFYAPFQYSGDKTTISTDFGDAGNAHSEYLGALSETGLPGALIFISIIIAGLLTGIRGWYNNGRCRNGYFVLSVTAGLLTYVIHGAMNSFLDTDKISALFWGFIAILVAIDLRAKEKEVI
jgi:putative inorganic carbon (hco3(-)) transporter